MQWNIGERVNRAGDKINTANGQIAHPIDTGYKVFSLTPRPELNAELYSTIKRSTQNTLYNMMAISGACFLSDLVEEIEANVLYKVRDFYFVLGECQTDMEPHRGAQIYIDGYADIRLNLWFNMLGIEKESVKILY